MFPTNHVPNCDPTAKLVTEAFMAWDSSLPPYEDIDVTDVDASADEIIRRHKQDAMTKRGRLPFEGLWYRRGGDAWITDEDWVQLAKRNLEFGDIRWLERLLLLGLHEYREQAIAILDHWLAQGSHDYDNYMGLIVLLYPDHEPSRKYVEVGMKDFDLQFDGPAAAIQDQGPLLDSLVTYINNLVDADCEEDAVPWIVRLGREKVLRHISDNRLQLVRQFLINSMKRSVAQADGLYVEEVNIPLQEAIAFSAVMGWRDLASVVKHHRDYLRSLFYFRSSDFQNLAKQVPKAKVYRFFGDQLADHLLSWSWGWPEDAWTGRLSAYSMNNMPPFTGPGSKWREAELASAIAWVRHRATTRNQ